MELKTEKKKEKNLSLFLEKTNNIDKLLLSLPKGKKKRERNQVILVCPGLSSFSTENPASQESSCLEQAGIVGCPTTNYPGMKKEVSQ